MTTNRPLRVFLCHSSNDKPAVRELYQKLRAETWIEPWLDEEELYPGQDWNLEIEKAVEAADAIIVCLSKGSITKEGYVQRELRIVLDYADYKPEGTLYIMPVRLEECEPPRRLRAWQYANYFEGQRERGLQRLLVSLKRRADSLGFKFEESPKSDLSENSLSNHNLSNSNIFAGTEDLDNDSWKKSIEEKSTNPFLADLEANIPAWLQGAEEKPEFNSQQEDDKDLPPWLHRDQWEANPPQPTPTSPSDWYPAEKAKTSEPISKPAYAEKKSDSPLNQAKSELDPGDILIALEHYAKLIKKGKHLEEIIHDLTESLYHYPVEVGIWQTLGDAYMRANRLKEALEAHNKAEELIR